MPGRHAESDRPRVDVAEDVTAHFLVARAHVAARTAADASEGVPCERVVAHRRAAVIEEHEVKLLRAVHADLRLELDVGRSRGTGDELRVGGDLLARPA